MSVPKPRANKPQSVQEASVVDLSHDGRGVARIADKAVFITGALPGERVRLRVLKRSRSYDEAELLEVLQPSPQRVEPPCPHYGHCSGCVLQHLEPAAQIAAKQATLLDNLQRIGGLRPEQVLAPLTGSAWGYRRRGRFSVRPKAKSKQVSVGFRELGNPRAVVDLQSCIVAAEPVGRLVAPLAGLLSSMDGGVAMPQVEFSVGNEGAAFVLRHLQPLSMDDLQRVRAFAAEHGVRMYLQPGGADSVQALDGGEHLLHMSVDGDLRLAFDPTGFIQVNAELNDAMIAHAMTQLDLAPTHRVLDLFCGLGNFSLPIARRVAAVVGVEGDAALVQLARDNAAANGLQNAEFERADLTLDEPRASWRAQPFDRILIDPPRSGAAEVVSWIAALKVQRLVYVSCHPGSLARDAAILVRSGYRLRAAGVMDMFPHTAHVESIAVFEHSRRGH